MNRAKFETFLFYPLEQLPALWNLVYGGLVMRIMDCLVIPILTIMEFGIQEATKYDVVSMAASK